MTNLAIMSDLHIDSNHFGKAEEDILIETLQEEQIQHLHLAGDISNQFQDISLPFIQRLEQHFSLSYNLGNHDMLGMTEQEIQSHDFQVHHLGRTKLLSLAGWYDYGFVAERTESQHLQVKNSFWFDRKLDRPRTDKEIAQDLLHRLDRSLTELAEPCIVSLHFVPHEDFLFDHPYFQRFNAFMGSPAFHEIFQRHQVTDVVFGHLHHRYQDRIIDGVRYHARPLGYIREWQLTEQFFQAYPQHRIPQMYRLHKRYNLVKDLPEFQAFKSKNLTQEFRSAMTIFRDV